MIPRRDPEGWRDLGPLTWRVERQDNHGDRSTTTSLDLTFVAHWSLKVQFTRDWKSDEDHT
jgi:hypothetical protein